jgi:protein-S-isoprenylcysteine O-methyltransferase Ste14
MTTTPASISVRRFNMAAFVILMTGLPVWVWYCLIAVTHYDGALVWPSVEFWSYVEPPSVDGLLFYAGWLALQAGLYHFLPGRREEGQPLPDGSRLTYRLNGLASFAISLGLWALLHATGLMPGDFIYLHLPTILGTANVVVLGLCVYVYVLGRAQATAEERRLNALEAFFVGAARNPRNGRFDWKFFCESRPGLTFWVLIAFSCAAHQYETFGHITNAMGLVCFSIFLYIADYYVHEDAILTTWDIVHEPFGWMLCWGSLVYVPFFYPLAAIWLASHAYSLPMWAAIGILILNVTGYVIFRQCNIQKHRFRKDPATKIWGKPPTFIQTERGTKLLTSGWWGVASHANYLGDLMMALAMGLTVGGNTVFGYGYFFAFVILLIHRDWRDDRHCAAKYGDDWKAYRAKVRWHIVPGLY